MHNPQKTPGDIIRMSGTNLPLPRYPGQTQRLSQIRMAKQCGYDRSTICRDIARLNRIRWGGHTADQRYRADKSMERRIRAEDKTEVERAHQD